MLIFDKANKEDICPSGQICWVITNDRFMLLRSFFVASNKNPPWLVSGNFLNPRISKMEQPSTLRQKLSRNVISTKLFSTFDVGRSLLWLVVEGKWINFYIRVCYSPSLNRLIFDQSSRCIAWFEFNLNALLQGVSSVYIKRPFVETFLIHLGKMISAMLTRPSPFSVKGSTNRLQKNTIFVSLCKSIEPVDSRSSKFVHFWKRWLVPVHKTYLEFFVIQR